MDLTKTVFGDLRKAAVEVVRVKTTQSLYFVAFHNERGRRFVVVRGQEGSDREHVVVRDSDPRIGDESLFDVPLDQWVGQVMEVATMRTSPITSAEVEPEASSSLREKLKLEVEPPPGLDNAPRIMPGLGRGTNMANAQPRPVNVAAAIPLGVGTGANRSVPAGNSTELARQVVVGEGPQLPYPVRHVVYAENVTAFLRSIHRRESLWDDIADDKELRTRYLRALEDAEDLLKLIKRRAKK